ncbi:MAG: tail fiber protein [Acidovorax sp.]
MTPFIHLRPAWAAALLACAMALPAHAGTDPFIGELMTFPRSCPSNGGDWMPAAGQTLSINNYQALFALLGTTYGGDGQTTFMLPDLRSRQPVGTGQGLGLSNVVLGEVAGVERTTLMVNQMPAHVHGLPATTSPATTATPAAGLLPAQAQNAGMYASGPASAAPTSAVGGNQPVNVRAPYLGVVWCIAVQGIFPSRN